MNESAVAASARGASLLILLQVASRALTFVLNQVLLRFVTPELLGTAVQLDLYCISVLYFSRESLRVALQRRVITRDGTTQFQTVINLAYLAFCAGIPISILFGKLYLASRTPDTVVTFLATSRISPLTIYGLAALVELLSEPAFVVAQQRLDYKTRASAEASATVTKTLTTVGLVVLQNRSGSGSGHLSVLPFALGQLVWATTLLVVYTVRTGIPDSKTYTLLPRRIQDSPSEEYLFSLFNHRLLRLSLTISIQSGFKYLLTQGDSLLITSLASLQDQGAYALASNYGGLIARMLFQPIEEASRTLFAKLCSPGPGSGATTHSDPGSGATNHSDPGSGATTHSDPGSGATNHSDPGSDATNHSDPGSRPHTQSRDTAKKLLTRILKSYTILSLPIVSVGPSLVPLVLPVLLGRKWSSTPAIPVLGAYVFYIPLLALNGVSEAFLAAVASESQLGRQSVAMAANFLIAFAAPAYLLVRVCEFGAVGLVGANALNMGARIAFNTAFVRRFFARAPGPGPRDDGAAAAGPHDAGTESVETGFSLGACLPGRSAVCATICAWIVLRATEGSREGLGVIWELVRIGTVGTVLVGMIMWTQRDFLLELYEDFAPGRGRIRAEGKRRSFSKHSGTKKMQ